MKIDQSKKIKSHARVARARGLSVMGATVVALGALSGAVAVGCAWWAGIAVGDMASSATIAMVAGDVVIVGLGIALIVLLCLRAHRSIRPLSALREVLLDLRGGERSLGAMSLDPRLGWMAEAWNAHVSEIETLRTQALGKHLEQAASQGHGGDAVERACDALWHGLLVIDQRERVVYANGAAGILLGQTRDALTGREVGEVLSDAGVIAAVKQAVAGAGKRQNLEVKRTSGGHEHTLRFGVARSARDGAGVVLVFIDDLTQQRAADAARDAFVAQATHELRTPLTNVRLYVERALEEGKDDVLVRNECLNVINQEARRLERIVGDMLSVAEIEAGSWKITPGDVRLDHLFEELRDGHESSAREKEITLKFELPPKLPVVSADRDKLLMALHNLVGNAIKYTPAGGEVVVSVETGPTGLVVMVQDNGIGIAPDEAERVFEKFYRSKDGRVSKIPGTGLGLALARDVVRMHGGEITLQSQLNRGSTFLVTLPKLAQAA